MVTLKEINYSDFMLENFKWIIGEYATYNHYYKLIIVQNDLILKVGLQIEFFGVEPQIEVVKNNILIGAGSKFYAYTLSGELINQYSIEPAFYEFIVIGENVLVIGEITTFLLDNFFNIIWFKEFNEIIDVIRIEESNIIIEDYYKNIICLDLYTGEQK